MDLHSSLGTELLTAEATNADRFINNRLLFLDADGFGGANLAAQAATNALLCL